MATDSSSGTLPSSSRLTIDSSSSIARSKGIFFTSALLSAISTVRRFGWAHPMPSHGGEDSADFLAAHQRGDMGGDGARQALQIIAAFEQRDDASLGARVGD